MLALSPQQRTRRIIFLTSLMLITSGLVYLALVLPLSTRFSNAPLIIGQVAVEDIVAPYPLTYPSEILTEIQRDEAAARVPAVYTPPDTGVARQQLERLRAALAYITSVRADAFASNKQKLADLAALEDTHLDQDTATSILNLSDARWQSVQQEAIVVLEQVMRTTIREDRLEEARRSAPALVSLSMPEDHANIIANLVVTFIAPNSLFNETHTEQARVQARDSVQPVARSFVAGETVVSRGRVIGETDLEALQQFGLAQPQNRWQDRASAAALTLLSMAFIVLYLARKRFLIQDHRNLGLIAALFLAFLLGARLIIPGHAIIPYIFPIAAYSLVVAALLGPEPALLTALPLAILTSYGLPNALDLTFYYILGSFFGVLTLGRALRITSFFWAGLAIAASGMAVILAYRLALPSTDWIGLATLIGSAAVNGIASASLTVLLQFFLAQFLGMTTPLQLIEISRPDHPLLQFILRNAPGTYQHSLQVANLAEQAAERIGADTLLTRVGALYHDVGKALDPIFFIENQVAGNINPHHDLEPATSATLIIRHVPEGLELARKHRLPRRIQDFISQHHGTMIARYQYAKALEAVGGDESQVDIAQFRYPGPRPQSRETALLMLADGSEAQMRAERPNDEKELRALIRSVVDQRIAMGELDDTDLTMKNLDAIVESFTATLRGIYHPRIQYPKLEAGSVLLEQPPRQETLPEKALTNPDAAIQSTKESTSFSS